MKQIAALYRLAFSIPYVFLALAFPIMATDAWATEVIGTFRPAPALSLYVIKEQPGPIGLRIGLLRGPNRQLGDHVSVRVFDPQEELIFRRHLNLGEPQEEFILGSMEIEGLNYDMAFGASPEQPDRPWADLRIALDQPGIYQVRVTAGSHNTFVRLEAPEPLAYGVSFQNGQFSHWPEQPQTLWAFVPPKAAELTLQGQGVEVGDEQGRSLLAVPHGRGSASHDLAVSSDQLERLWQFRMHPRGAFRAWGFPLILCNTPEAARAIRASVIELPDGTVVAHRFQQAIYERLRDDWLSEERIGRLEDIHPQFTEAHRQAMEEDALAAWLLVNRQHNLFNYVHHLLAQQNTDPASHFAGSLIGWQEVAARDGLAGRWDAYRVRRPLVAGISSGEARWASTLAWLCTEVDRPWNPYHGNRQVIHRLAAGALADLLRLGEDERFPDHQSNDYPGGNVAFHLAWKPASAFGALAPHVDPDMRALWTRAIRHLLDRSYADTIVSTRNQSAHYLMIFHDLARGSGDPADAELREGYARRFIASQHPAGWMDEAMGPDATYNGITHWYMGEYARAADDPAMFASIARSYRFFNHTVAPEPGGGAVRGGFNFAHRTASGFYGEQYGGARQQVADRVPEVAVWRGAAADREAARRQAEAQVRAGLAKPQDERARVIYMDFIQSRFGDVQATPLEATWPALEEAPFIRNFADQLIAVRRPGYFASIFVGKPAGAWYIRNKEALREPYPDDQESRGGRVGGLNHKPLTPLLGGGLSLLHSPGYGSAVLATNWSPLTYHGPVLIREDGTRAWADYHATTFELDEAAGRLVVRGALDGAPVNLERTYTFADKALHQQVRFVATEAVSGQSFFENLPLALGDFKARGVSLAVAGASAPLPGEVFETQVVQLRDGAGHGFDLRFAQPQRLVYQPNGLLEGRGDGELQVGRIQVMLPVPTTETPVVLAYTFEPVVPAP